MLAANLTYTMRHLQEMGKAANKQLPEREEFDSFHDFPSINEQQTIRIRVTQIYNSV